MDTQRDTYGVESICAHLPIAPATYWRHKAQQRDPARRSARAQRDDALKAAITRVWTEHEQVYGAEKVWRQFRREAIPAAQCTIERLMKALGLRGAVRGGAFVVTTRPDETVVVPDLVDRQFNATRPNPLWVSDFTYVSTTDGFAERHRRLSRLGTRQPVIDGPLIGFGRPHAGHVLPSQPPDGQGTRVAPVIRCVRATA